MAPGGRGFPFAIYRPPLRGGRAPLSRSVMAATGRKLDSAPAPAVASVRVAWPCRRPRIASGGRPLWRGWLAATRAAAAGRPAAWSRRSSRACRLSCSRSGRAEVPSRHGRSFRSARCPPAGRKKRRRVVCLQVGGTRSLSADGERPTRSGVSVSGAGDEGNGARGEVVRLGIRHADAVVLTSNGWRVFIAPQPRPRARSVQRTGVDVTDATRGLRGHGIFHCALMGQISLPYPRLTCLPPAGSLV